MRAELVWTRRGEKVFVNCIQEAECLKWGNERSLKNSWHTMPGVWAISNRVLLKLMLREQLAPCTEQWEWAMGISTAALCLAFRTTGWKSHHMTLGIMLNPLQHSPLLCSSHTSYKTCGLWLTARGSLWAVSGGIILNFKWQFTGIFSFFQDAVLHSTLSIPEINNWSREF